MTTAAEGFLYLLRDQPTLLPPAEGADGAAIHRRAQDEVHTCLHCGGRAQQAFIAHTSAGERWLDLCARCAMTVAYGVEA